MKLKEIIKKIFGRTPPKTACQKRGHNWKMQHDGWTTEGTNWDPDKARKPDGSVDFRGMTKKKIYYLCKRCGAHGHTVKKTKQ